MKQNVYMVMHIENNVGVNIDGEICKTPMPLIWADRMIGVAPIFATIEEAKSYAGESQICEIEYYPLEQK